jgi:hypothetical protein
MGGRVKLFFYLHHSRPGCQPSISRFPSHERVGYRMGQDIPSQVKQEYEVIKKRLKESVNPIDIGKKSTRISSNKVLIKGAHGRYVVEVTTPQFIFAFMKKSKSDFLEPGYPYIIVSKLTDEIIQAAIQAYIDTEDD